MAKGYLIAHATVTNPEKWAEYIAKSKIALDKFGGTPIVRGGRYEIFEGNGAARNVIIEFPSYENAINYLKSAEYAEAKAARNGAGTADVTVVEGL